MRKHKLEVARVRVLERAGDLQNILYDPGMTPEEKMAKFLELSALWNEEIEAFLGLGLTTSEAATETEPLGAVFEAYCLDLGIFGRRG